jgi:SSS family solute:Na+ symporter
VSTANSQLLLATCSFCYDLFPAWSANGKKDFLSEDHFLFINRLGIAGLATFSLLLSQLPLPGILDLGQYSWAVVAICFFLPLYLPGKNRKEHLFKAITIALFMHTFLVYGFHVRPEQALLPSLGVEGILWWISSKGKTA